MTSCKSTATSCIIQDYLRLKKDPIPYIEAEPLPSNMLIWHYVVKGPEDTPYQGGYYHGVIFFPPEFPFKPPSIYVLTPNGRFKTNRRLCLSITDYHPVTWNPTWSIGTILIGLLSFMLDSTPTLGSMESSLYDKQQYAKKSLEFNLKNTVFCELFPQTCEEIRKEQEKLLQQPMIEGGTNSATRNTGNYNPAQNYNNDKMNSFGGKTNGSSSANDSDSNSEDIEFDEIWQDIYFNNNLHSSCCNWRSMCSTLLAILGFALFALIANYVIENLD